MPIIKSAIKRARQNQRRHEHNLTIKKAFKVQIKSLLKLLESGDKTAAAEQLKTTVSKIDLAAKNGVIHKNTAARKKSRLTKLVQPPQQSSKAAKPKSSATPKAKATTKAKAAAPKPKK